MPWWEDGDQQPPWMAQQAQQPASRRRSLRSSLMPMEGCLPPTSRRPQHQRPCRSRAFFCAAGWTASAV